MESGSEEMLPKEKIREPASIEKMAYPLPDKPSIAVLPFTNMSGDPSQDYIGDGLSENITSALSVSSKLFVIARNSTFTYKGKPVKVQQVAEGLGVQYVLEGSIQKAGDRLRVTAQLIDALTGHHLWSEKYDRKMEDLFDFQDEVTKKIMVSLQVELSHGRDFQFYSKSTDNLEAWKHYIKGVELHHIFNEEDNIRAIEHFEAAIKLDPEFNSAMVYLAQTHNLDTDPNSYSISQKKAFELVQRAIRIDEKDSFAHAILGYLYLNQSQHEKAIAEGRRAVNLNPNHPCAHAFLGIIMHYYGLFDESITHLEKTYRLDPKFPPVCLFYLAKSYIMTMEYEKALEICNLMDEHAQKGNLQEFGNKSLFAEVYQALGKEDEDRAFMAEALKLNPSSSLALIKMGPQYKNPEHLQRVMDGLRKAGMPEEAPKRAVP